MKKLLLSLSLCTIVSAESLDELIKMLKNQNLSLQSEKDSIKIAKEEIQIASRWDNPTLSIGANDLLLDDFGDRSKEPMQTQFLSLSQKIPLGGKKRLMKNIATVKSSIADINYIEKYKHIVSLLSRYAYRVAIIDKKLQLLKRSKRNLNRVKKLETKLLSISKAKQSTIEDIKISLKSLTIKRRRLQRQKRTILHKIEELVYSDISDITINLNMNKTPTIDLKQHPLIINADLEIEKNKESLELAKADKIPDLRVGVGYFQRENRSDYLSINAGVKLPIYGKEESKITQALLRYKQAKRAKKELTYRLQKRVAILKEKMSEAKKNYQTLKEEMLPKKRYIQKLLTKEIYTKQNSFATLLININEMIELDFKAYEEMERYFDAYSLLLYFKGRR